MTATRRRSVLRRVGGTAAMALVFAALAGAAAWLVPHREGEAAPVVSRDRPNPPAQRSSVENGQTVVKITGREERQIGIKTAVLKPGQHREEFRAYGAVLDLARITDLTNSYANARAQLQTAQAKLEVSKSAFQRAKNLGQYVATAALESAEGTFRTDQAALASAESQVRTLAATAQQEWGPVIGKAIAERLPTITRLIEREQLLVQVTLPPAAILDKAPETALAEVPARGSRVDLRFISAATRTDQRIQGLSYFYAAPGDSGLLPGMNTIAFMPSSKVVEGVVVPEAAIVRWQGSAWVYLKIGLDTFARHQITTDLPVSDDDYVVRTMPQGSEVVVQGAQALLSEETKNQLQAGGGADND